MKTMTTGQVFGRFAAATFAAGLMLCVATGAFAAVPPSTGGAGAAVTTSALGVDCTGAGVVCEEGLICDDVCRRMTPAEREIAASQKEATKAAEKKAAEIKLAAAEKAADDAHALCVTDATKCGKPVRQADERLAEAKKALAKAGVVKGGNADVTAFQVHYGLAVDGQVGPETCGHVAKVGSCPKAVSRACAAYAEKSAPKPTLADVLGAITGVGDKVDALGDRVGNLETRMTALETPATPAEDTELTPAP